MFKSKKSALNTEDLAGIVIIMFIAGILIFSFTIFNVLSQTKKEKQIEVSLEDLNTNYNFDYFLRSQVEGGKIIADLINEAYLSNEYAKLKALSDEYFKYIGFSGLSYDIYIGKNSLNSIDLAGILIGSTSQLPLISKEVIEVELAIGEPRLTMVSP